MLFSCYSNHVILGIGGDNLMEEITVLLIRHGKTQGNLEQRYIGCNTDESLCETGIEELQVMKQFFSDMKLCDTVYVSPMLRCRQTAEILLPVLNQRTVEAFRETDFGEFENKNYEELNGNPNYQSWIDSGCEDDCPGGEGLIYFKERSVRAFGIAIENLVDNNCENGVILCHGGSIMSVLSMLTGKGYYDFHIGNCEAYELILEAYCKRDNNRGEEYALLSYNRI